MTHEIVWTLDANNVTARGNCDDPDCIHRYTCDESCEVIYDVRRDGDRVSHGLFDWEGETKPHVRHEMFRGDYCNVVEFLDADRYMIPELYDGTDEFEVGRIAIEPVWQGDEGMLWKRAGVVSQ